MFANLPISRKIGSCFAAIVLAVAAMMAVLYVSNARIETAAAHSIRAEEVHSTTLDMEIAILRQNSQVRGFLITTDDNYLKQYKEAKADGAAAAARLEALLTTPEDRAQVASSNAKIVEWREKWGDPLIARVHSGDQMGAQAALRASSKTVTMLPVLAPLRALRAQAVVVLRDSRTEQAAAQSTALVALAIGGVAMIGIAIALSLLLGRQLAKPIVRLTQTMGDLAAGNNDVTVPDAARADELGRMSQAVLVFRDAAIGKARSDAEQRETVARVGAALGQLADADLTARLVDFPPAYASLERDFNGAIEQLAGTLETVRTCSAGIEVGTGEISRASDDLSRRTEQQAASLEETAAAMDEITATVREAASGAARADAVVVETRTEAQAVGEIVRQAVDAMGGIERASAEISEIISVIDGIAFQTNLLALNAGVEAARAGDAGRGFAVVASEVRALAQRSADAARDVKTRITASAVQVDRGVALVGETGQALDRIIGRVEEIGGLVSTIASSATQQAQGMEQVNIAVGEMDGVTQQNAAMVEESNAAVRTLSTEAEELLRQVGRFNLPTGGRAAFAAVPAVRAVPARTPRPAAPAPRSRPAAAPAPRPATRGSLALKVEPEDDWSAF